MTEQHRPGAATGPGDRPPPEPTSEQLPPRPGPVPPPPGPVPPPPVPAWAEERPTPQQRRGGLLSSGVGRIVLAGLVVAVVTAVGWWTGAGRGDDGAIDRAGDLAATSLRVGDCLMEPDGDEFGDVSAIPCAEPHELELFHVFSMTGGHPTDEAVTTAVGERCLPAFDAYVGQAYERSELDIVWFSPTVDGWEAGDHEIQCLLFAMDGSDLVGSMRGTGR